MWLIPNTGTYSRTENIIIAAFHVPFYILKKIALIKNLMPFSSLFKASFAFCIEMMRMLEFWLLKTVALSILMMGLHWNHDTLLHSQDSLFADGSGATVSLTDPERISSEQPQKLFH